ncbi:hypothetical protein Tco_0978135 [Tanacetum coccineum]|uniref:Uncharacterized protein n=1 Tax=Tanacetum coccineum TaxID=301880 RepID=A0ABQ5EM35_9ASTR
MESLSDFAHTWSELHPKLSKAMAERSRKKKFYYKSYAVEKISRRKKWWSCGGGVCCVALWFRTCLKDDTEAVLLSYTINGNRLQYGREGNLCLIVVVVIRRPAKYTLSGFTWAFKTWILEAYKERALNYYTHVDRHPRAVAWVNGETFYRSYLEPFFEGAEPIRRLRADAFEAKAEWWVSSRAFFDGHICEPPQIPTAVSNDLYQRVAEHNRLIKELQQQNVDQYKIMNSMNKNFKEGLNASSMPGPMKAPFEVREHFGLSDLSGFQNTECGP